MKKLTSCILFLFLLLSLTACQPDAAAESTLPGEVSLLITEPVVTDSPVLDLGGKTIDELTAREVVDDYLAGSERLASFRSVNESGRIFIYLPGRTNGATCVNPDHLYPSDSWTPEDVVQSYLDDTAPWLKTDNTSQSYADLWSWDCEHYFRIQDGWLYVDNVKCLPFGCQTVSSIDPMDLLAAYQAGEWDGSRVYSEDYCTSVYVDRDGMLSYSYSNPAIPATDYAYTGCAEQPWWRIESHDYDIKVFSSSTHDNQLTSEQMCINDLCVDLPGGKLDGSVSGDLIKLFPVERRDGQLWVTTTAGCYLFQRGKKLNQWLVNIDASDGYVYNPNWQEYQGHPIYLYTDKQLLELKDHGQYEVRLARTAGFDTNYETTCDAYFIENGALKVFNCWDASVETVLSQDVVDAAGFNHIFVQLSDGYTYWLPSLTGNASDPEWDEGLDPDCVRLGTESPVSIDARWREWDGSFYEFLKDCNNLYPG